MIRKILTAFVSFSFFMIGADKFLNFLEPPCSMMDKIPPTIWSGIGVLQIAAGILIWFPKYRKTVAALFAMFMLTFTIIHLGNRTYDIGGSAVMAILLGLIAWDPPFLQGKNSSLSS